MVPLFGKVSWTRVLLWGTAPCPVRLRLRRLANCIGSQWLEWKVVFLAPGVVFRVKVVFSV